MGDYILTTWDENEGVRKGCNGGPGHEKSAIFQALSVVEVTGFEPATFWSRKAGSKST